MQDVDLNDLRKVVQDTLQSGGVLGKLRVSTTALFHSCVLAKRVMMLLAVCAG